MLPLVPPERTWIITAKAMKERVRLLLPDAAEEQILAEPAGRNTAPAIGWAAAKILETDPDAVMFVLPSDHVIKPENVFRQTLQEAAALVQSMPEMLLTLGIKPVFPATSYGYIQKGAEIKDGVFYARKFCEKPPLPQAEEYFQSGQYFWNAGIFIWKARMIWDLLHRYEPEIGQRLDEMRDSFGSNDEAAVTEECFAAMKSISIDYAVMERAETVGVLATSFDWNDVGTWRALDRLYAHERDADGNIAVNVKTAAVNSSNCTVRGNEANRLVVLVGIHDTVVVQTDDTVLIMKKDQEELLGNCFKE